MATLLLCERCGNPSAVNGSHHGRSFPCPACDAPIAVPEALVFRAHRHGSLADRRSGYRAMTVAWFSTILCMLPIPAVTAVVWWWASRRIGRARDEGREVAEPLLAARTIAAVACVCQTLTLGRVVWSLL